MEFMEVYQLPDELCSEYVRIGFKKIFIQEDVWDFHVFRILNDNGVIIAEMEEINKEKVADHLNLDDYNNVRGLFKSIDPYKVCKAVMEVDIDNGCESMESCKFTTIEEAIEEIRAENDIIDLVK